MKIRPVGAELFHADGRTDGRPDIRKPNVVFRILRARLKTVLFVNVLIVIRF